MKHKQDMTPELEKKLNACKSAEDVRRLMEVEGMALSLDDLEMVTGGKVDYFWNNFLINTINNDVVTVNGKKYFRGDGGELLEYIYSEAPFLFPYDGTSRYRYYYFFPDGSYTSCYPCNW